MFPDNKIFIVDSLFNCQNNYYHRELTVDIKGTFRTKHPARSWSWYYKLQHEKDAPFNKFKIKVFANAYYKLLRYHIL